MQTSLTSGEEDGLREMRSPGLEFAEKSRDHKRNLLDKHVGPTVIQRFYAGSSVLVTGATGFMGKVLIEKLLRSCPDIHTVYMMVREKKGRSLEERIDDLVGSPCFNRIKKERPDFRSKLRAVAGDIGLESLGISAEDRHLLQLQVDIVFHVAATVRFDEPLSSAIFKNVRGTREVLTLCRTFRKLRSVVHVSTAYSNCPQTKIDERFYAPLIPSDHAIHLAETADHVTVDRLSHILTGKWPNTYSFTKALSEDVVRNHGQDLPAAVFRPSIVVCTKSEPMEGWIDNVYGPSGVLLASSAGLLRTMQVNQETEANIVPCDMVINALVACAWDVADNRPTAATPVYNYVAPRRNRFTWKRFTDLYCEHGQKAPPLNAIWVSNMTLIANRTVYLMFRLLVHFLPAMLVDICLLATNRSPQMVHIYGKIHRFTNVIAYFATKQWDFETKNVDDMWAELHWRDKELFFFDMNSLDWYRYVQDTCLGLRVNLLKDPVETIPAAKAKWQRLRVLHHSLQVLLIAAIIGVSTRVLPLLWTALGSVVEETVLYRLIS